MSGHRKKPLELSEPEIRRFVEAATQLHNICCDPLIAPWGTHYQALEEVNQAICRAILALTGKQAEWIHRSSSL